MRNGSRISLTKTDRFDLVKKASESSIESAAGNDSKKLAFLNEVGAGKSKEFFKDVLLQAKYVDNPKEFKGRCCYSICSSDYITYIERQVFQKDLPTIYGGSNGNRKYGKLISTSLESIAKQIETDIVNIPDIGDVYLRKEYKVATVNAIRHLRKCNISVPSKVEDTLKMLYIDIEYYNEETMKKYMGAFKMIQPPSRGVVGIGASIEVGLGLYVSGKQYYVRDAYGNLGIAEVYGIGGGIGYGVFAEIIGANTVNTIFDLQTTKDSNLGASASVDAALISLNAKTQWNNSATSINTILDPYLSLGAKMVHEKQEGFYSENNRAFQYYKGMDTKIPLKNITKILTARSTQDIKKLLKPGLSMNGQVLYTLLTAYKKVKREDFHDYI